jgi:hypothetical protein
VGRGVIEMLQITCDQLTTEKEEEKEHADILEQGLTTTYNHIPNNVQATERSAEEKINLIAQTIDQYRQEIEELKERLNPMTPPEVREKRKQEVALQMVEMEKQASAVEELFDRATQLWTMLEEDEQVQQWDQEEERVSATIQDLKQRQENNEHHRAPEGYSRYEEVAVRFESSADAEARETRRSGTPPRESTQMMHSWRRKIKTWHKHKQRAQVLMQEEITMQTLEVLTGKVVQIRERGKELEGQVPQPGRGCSGSTHYLGGSG